MTGDAAGGAAGDVRTSGGDDGCKRRRTERNGDTIAEPKIGGRSSEESLDAACRAALSSATATATATVTASDVSQSSNSATFSLPSASPSATASTLVSSTVAQPEAQTKPLTELGSSQAVSVTSDVPTGSSASTEAHLNSDADKTSASATPSATVSATSLATQFLKTSMNGNSATKSDLSNPIEDSATFIPVSDNTATSASASATSSATVSAISLTLGLASLPPDILLLIASYLPPSDLLSLSLVSRDIRNATLPLCFRHIYLEWTQMVDLRSHLTEGFLIPAAPSVKSLTITKPSAYGEWHHAPVLEEILRLSPSITTLRLSFSGSSNWLKYVKGEHVTELEAISHEESVSARLWRRSRNMAQQAQPQSQPQPPTNEETIRRRQSRAGQLAQPKMDIFDLDHLAGFQNLRHLSLHGFLVRRESAVAVSDDFEQPVGIRGAVEPPFRLLGLRLENCTWEYPLTLIDFGPEIRELALEYSEKYRPYTYSERLRQAIVAPPASVARLTVHFRNRPRVHRVGLVPFSAIEEPQVAELSLEGFDVSSALVRGLPKSLRRLRVELGTFETDSVAQQLEAEQFTEQVREAQRRAGRMDVDSLEIDVQVVVWDTEQINSLPVMQNAGRR